MLTWSRLLIILVLVAALPACSSDDPPVDELPDAGALADASTADANNVCANSTLTYATFGQPFITDYCLRCHSETAVNRRGAPPNVNFDTFELVNAQKSRIKARAGMATSMPPSPGAQPSAEERASLVEWIDCGPVN